MNNSVVDAAAVEAIGGRPMWVVMRHSGRSNGHWRMVFDGDERAAREKYDAVSLELRQGRVVLYDPQARLVASDSGPTLRTRW